MDAFSINLTFAYRISYQLLLKILLISSIKIHIGALLRNLVTQIKTNK